MSTLSHPPVSVLSLTHNRRDKLANLLTALRRQTYPSFEVIVIDNASEDGTAALIRSAFPEVRLLESPHNLGNYSYNLGVDAAVGEYILLIDDDGLPAHEDWIARVVTRLRANPRLGAAACMVRMQDTGRLAPDSPQFIPSGDEDSGYPCPAYNGTGVGLRSAAVRAVGSLYAEHLFLSYVELHFSTRLLEAGWEVRLFPDLTVWHCRPSGSSNPQMSYYGLRNYLWYVWELYPWPQVLTETLHEFGRIIRATLTGRAPVACAFRSTRDAIRQSKGVLARRRPISPGTLEYLRSARRHGNWHGMVPEVVTFNGNALRTG